MCSRVALLAALLLAAGSALGAWDLVGDINGDGVVDFGDINPFVKLLSGGSPPCPAGPVAWYPFDGNAREYGPHAIHGTVVDDITYTAPFCGEDQAASFYAGHIEAPDNDKLDLTGSFTIEMWLYLTGNEGYKLVSKHEHGTNNDGSWSLEAGVEAGAGFLRWNALPAGPDVVFDSDHGVIPLDTWTHIAIAYDELSDQYAFYVNGHPAGSGPAGLAGKIENTRRSLWIGELEGTPDPRPLAGDIDELFIWDRCLTQAQVRKDMSRSCHDDVLLVCSSDSDGILRYDAWSDELLGVFAELDFPHAVVVGPDGYVYVSAASPNIWRYDAWTGLPVDPEPFITDISSNVDLTFGPDGALYVIEYGNPGTVHRCGGDGQCREFTTDATELNSPIGLVFGPDGDLYVTSSTANNVQRFDGLTGDYKGVFAEEGLQHPNGLAFGPDGTLYVCSGLSDQILRFEGATGDPLLPHWECPLLNKPRYLRFGPDGNLYVTSQYSNTVMRFELPSGDCGIFVPSGTLSGPRGLEFLH